MHFDESAATVSPSAACLVAEGRLRRCRRRRFWESMSPLGILLAVGCGCGRNPYSQGAASTPSSKAAQADEKVAANKLQGSLVPADASPREVASAALQAIQSNDREALQSLVAIKKVKQDVQAITRGRSAFQGMVDKAVPTAVAAILSEINWLDPEGREIDQETITGTSALVTVKGNRDGQKHTRRLFLVQEDNHWRLVPSHR